MSKLTKEEYMNALKTIVGDSTADEDLNFLKDMIDTYDELEKASQDTTDWKTKYEENDASWRQRYKDTFFNKPDENHDDGKNDYDKAEKPLTYESLFKEGVKN